MAPPLLTLAHRNYAEFARQMGRTSEGGSVVERDGMLFVAGGSAFPVGYSNAALRVDGALPAADAFAAADVFFGELGRGYTLLVHAEQDADLVEAARARGQAPASQAPFMTAEHPLEAPDKGDVPELRLVEDVAGARDLVAVNRRAYGDLGMPAEETETMFGKTSRLLVPEIHAVVAYQNGRPISTAMILSSDRAAGVYWVGTVPDARGRGLAEHCTRVVTNAAFARGARIVSLEASKMGFPIYLRMGFETVGEVYWYVTPAPGG
jgi:ribosomal protein S18 acetylase RimI-like enzyme